LQAKKDADEIAALTRRLKNITEENDATESAVAQVRRALPRAFARPHPGPAHQALSRLLLTDPCRTLLSILTSFLRVCCLQLRKQLADLQASSDAAAAAAAKAAAALQAQLTQAHEEAATLRRRITELEGKAKAATEAHSAAATQLAEATRLHAPCGQRIAALEGKAAQDAAEVRLKAPFRRSRLVALMFWMADQALHTCIFSYLLRRLPP
jgi:septal ring factor EnvC (AmiA/AmiB activator)